jgi:adenosylcobinamide-GDP ribazoletransferase
MNPLRGLHLAHTFLTTLPLPHVGPVKDGEFRYASGFYPAVGWTLGALLALLALLTSSLPSGIAAALLLAVWLGLTLGGQRRRAPRGEKPTSTARDSG